MSQQQNWSSPMSAPAHATSFPLQTFSRESSGGGAPNFGYPPPPRQTPPSDGGYSPPQPSVNPFAENPRRNQPVYSGGQFAPPHSTPTPPIDQKAVQQHSIGAYNHNAALGQPSASSPTPPSPPSESARMTRIPGGAPAYGEFVGAQSITRDDVGTFNGGSYRLSHRDTNSLLTLQLAMGCPMTVRPGAMVSMSPTITLMGKFKFSFKKLIFSHLRSMTMSTFTGPGEVLLAPPMLGDIIVLRIQEEDNGKAKRWQVGRDSFLAHTSGVHHEYKSQGLMNAFFSGEGLFVYEITGVGLLWMQSFGAIIRKELAVDEVYIVDNGHLVAWNCTYTIMRVASGGIISAFGSGEGVACRFKGPGVIYFQTRNLNAFAAQMKMSTASG